MKVEIVTAERLVYAGDADAVIAPGVQGQLGILPHHAPLMTMLEPGELVLRKGGQESYCMITGGFLEVRGDKVVVLADACERCEEIDMERAEAARKRADEMLKSGAPEVDHARAEAALRRSIARLNVAERRRRRAGPSV
ncbi:MAG: F0F1 ATP synthase subunit epsilon [Chloroflexota bacterium]